MDPDATSPDFLVGVMARETFERDRVEKKTSEQPTVAERGGHREIARAILRARAARSDIQR